MFCISWSAESIAATKTTDTWGLTLPQTTNDN